MSSYSAADDWFNALPQRRARGGGGVTAAAAANAIAPILIGGALAVIAFAGQSKVGAWLRGFFSVRNKALPPQSALMDRVNEGLPLPLLRDSILGRRKVAIADLLGPPRTAVMTRPTPGLVGQAAFWRADTWYYAVDAESQTAMAVTFDANGMASDVDFFDAPQPPAGPTAVG